MKRSFFQIAIFLCLISLSMAKAQEHGFEFGKVLYADLDMKRYDRDTTAVAVVLDEFGDAFFDLNELNKIYLQYHVKIKILKEAGKGHANFEIPLRKSGLKQEMIRYVKASSFNREGNSWKESILPSNAVFTESIDKDWSVTKFAVPNVRVGSVVEVYYQLETPYTYNFIPWHFQSEIPKVKSEFWAKFPAYYAYNITLKGLLSLTKNTAEVVKHCVGSGYVGAPGADCSLLKFSMENLPAFKEEQYMTSKRNFMSAINFELMQITQFDGRVDKITNDWHDAEQELRDHESFGVQIKKARNAYSDKAKLLKANSQDAMSLIKSIHDHVKTTLTWDGEFGFLTDNGIKKTQETSKGNVADLNLSLLGMLNEAGIYAEPVLLSTRSRGLPIRDYPVLSDFNYVIVRAKIDDKFYFLDATSPLYTVGFIPARCLNGDGRALGDTKAWIELKPNDRERTVTDIKLKLNDVGEFSFFITVNYYGYAAYSARQEYFGATNEAEYKQKRSADWLSLELKSFSVENDKDLTKPFIEKFEGALENLTGNTDILYLQPFVIDRREKNPFTSNERLYPVDFGAALEQVNIITIEYPSAYQPEDLPKNIALAMPNNGGKYLFSATKLDGRINISSLLSLSKPVYISDEYFSLKEIFSRFMDVQQKQIVLKRVK